jgi:DNA topoisomerase-1
VLAAAAGLVHSPDSEPGYRRRRQGRGFSFVDAGGRPAHGVERERLVALAIPPAWNEVWICRDPRGHLQATGVDAAGRKQYRYHPDFRERCEWMKFDRLRHFGRALVHIRRDVEAADRAPVGSRRLAMAGLIGLLDVGLLRVGNEESADVGHHGATTLQPDHLIVDDGHGDLATLEFVGKGGSQRTIVIDDDSALRSIIELTEARADRIFWYHDKETGTDRSLRADEVNDHIASVAGRGLSAKDFRTWGGSRAALEARVGGADVLEAVDRAAGELGNSRAVARSSYVHPAVIEAEPSDIERAWGRSRRSRHRSRGDSALLKLLEDRPPLIER